MIFTFKVMIEGALGHARGRDDLGQADGRVRVYYLATAPDLFEPIAANLESAGLAGDDARIVLEKPVGRDLKSFREIDDATSGLPGSVNSARAYQSAAAV